MIIIIISFIDNLALFYLSLDGTLFPDVGVPARAGRKSQFETRIAVGKGRNENVSTVETRRSIDC